MRVIIGAGKVANVIKNKNDIVLDHSQIEVKDIESVKNNLDKFEAGTVIINTVSKINLEWCEENKDESYAVNTLGAINVAKVCMQNDFHLVHISSGCIFDGGETDKLYTEDDTPSPAAWYTKTKSEADQTILDLKYEKVTIVRPRQLISAIKNPTNMLTKFLSINDGKFITSKNSITCIEDMGDMIQHLIKGKHYGIYNLANQASLSPYEIAMRLSAINPKINPQPISYEQYVSSLKVKRVNTLLDISKLLSTGYVPRHAIDALEWCVTNYGAKQ